jgi:hypothetical protein
MYTQGETIIYAAVLASAAYLAFKVVGRLHIPGSVVVLLRIAVIAGAVFAFYLLALEMVDALSETT